MEFTSLLTDGVLVLGHAEDLRHRVVTTCAHSQRLIHTARVLRHLPLPSIRGASGSELTRPEDAIRARIREFLTRGLLSHEDPEVIVLLLFHRRCLEPYAAEASGEGT
jgi:hypothetical protein